MADEITLSAALKVLKGALSMQQAFAGLTFDMSGTDAAHHTQTVGTSAEALDIGDITACGFVLIVNRDATNYVTLRMGEAGADVVKLKAGEFALFRLAGNTPYAIADTESCVVEFWILED
jgi:hypothetical protein